MPDASIPSEERLYRWISKDQAKGERVLEAAIESAGTSVNREKYWPKPFEQRPPKKRPEHNGLACARVGDLPPEIPIGGVRYEAFAVDLPNPEDDPDNEAHAEIRTGRIGKDKPNAHMPGSPGNKRELKMAVARVLRVIKPPV